MAPAERQPATVRGDEPLALKLPESVYTLRSGKEILAALLGSGFQDGQIRIDPVSQLRLAIAFR